MVNVSDHLTGMLNAMRHGRVYTATTFTGSEITGQYLGYEVVHGDWSILLQDEDITVSLPLEDIDTVLLSSAAVGQTASAT